jgi:hypothetical protein
MAEPITPIELDDAMSDLVADARALEMAISGSASLDRAERRALIRTSEKLGDAIKALADRIEATRAADQEGEQ